MTTRIVRTLIYYADGCLLGYLLNLDDYERLGGKALADAFNHHHVRLVRTRSGQFEIVDDITSDAYRDDLPMVGIDEQPTGEWAISTGVHGEPDEYHYPDRAQLKAACLEASYGLSEEPTRDQTG